MIRMRVSLTVFVLTLVALPIASGAVAQASDSPTPRVEIGKPFPGLLFPALDGGKLTGISAFRGKKTIVHVFASW